MRHPLISLLVAIGFFLLGGMLMAPFTPGRVDRGPDGRGTQGHWTERRFAELRVNWAAYLCIAGAAVSFGWTVYLVSAGIVSIVRTRRHDNAA